jgi:hypothetical protein
MSLDLDPQGHPGPPCPGVAAANTESPRFEFASYRSHLADRGFADAEQAEVLCQLRTIVALLVDASFGVDPVHLAQPDVDKGSRPRRRAP